MELYRTDLEAAPQVFVSLFHVSLPKLLSPLERLGEKIMDNIREVNEAHCRESIRWHKIHSEQAQEINRLFNSRL